MFLPDGKRIVAWNYGEVGSARLWDTETGEELARLSHEAEIRGARVNRDASLIMTWGDDGATRVWRVRDGSLLYALRHDGNVRGAVFSSDETRILSWSDDRTARVWDARTGQPLSLPLQHPGVVEGAVFSADGAGLLTWDQRTARVWRSAPESERRMLSLVRDRPVLAAALRPADGVLVTLTADGSLYRSTRDREERIAIASSADIAGARLDVERGRVVGWSTDHAVGIWSIENGQSLAPPMRHDKSPLGIQGAVTSADGSRILSFGDDHTARVWDSANGQLLALLPHPGRVTGAVLTADNSRVLTWGDDRIVRLWDTEHRTALLTLPAHDYGVQGAALTRDKSKVLSWDSNGTLSSWDAADGKATGPFDITAGIAIRGAVLSRDEGRVLVWDQEGVGIWDLRRGTSGSLVRWNVDGVLGAAFNADEGIVVTRSGDGTARLWDSRYGYPLTTAFALDASVEGAVLSKDENSLLAWTPSLVRVWNVGIDRHELGAGPVLSLERLQLHTGTRLDRLGELETIPAKAWEELRDRIGPTRAQQ
jgi:WD40 repeat protein